MGIIGNQNDARADGYCFLGSCSPGPGRRRPLFPAHGKKLCRHCLGNSESYADHSNAYVPGRRNVPVEIFFNQRDRQVVYRDIYRALSSGPFPAEAITNPVLTYRDVSDIRARFVADPFMIRENGSWYMFFEVLNTDKDYGHIGLAESNDGLEWSYKQIVLDEPFHLSYPYVFKFNGEYYMVPETYKKNAVRLYKADCFPTKWRHISDLVDGKPFVDSSIFYFNQMWWMFTATAECNTLYLYHAQELGGPWTEHPMSPIIKEDLHIARPGGRTVVIGDRIIRFAQDDYGIYGNRVHAFEIVELSKESYMEKAVTGNPVLEAGCKARHWNGLAMHTVDPHKIAENTWIACVDGMYKSRVLTIKNRFINWRLGRI